MMDLQAKIPTGLAMTSVVLAILVGFGEGFAPPQLVLSRGRSPWPSSLSRRSSLAPPPAPAGTRLDPSHAGFCASPLTMSSGGTTNNVQGTMLEDNAAILLEACGLDRESAKLFAASSDEAGSCGKEGQDILVEGKAVQAKRSLYFILSGEVEMEIGGKAASNMVRGNFLGSARFIEEETLMSMSFIRGSPVSDAFYKADVDSSGSIDVQEIMGAFSRVGIDVSEEQARSVISLIDQDEDGEMSLEEAKSAAAKLRDNAKAMFKRADKDGSAMLEEAEIKNILKDAGIEVGDETMKQVMKFLVREFGQSRLTLSATLQKLEEATSGAELLRSSFNDFDKDDNGKISLDELVALLKSINIDLPRNQAEVLFSSVDLNGDGMIDYLEFETALDRVKARTIARFGNTLRLYETVAYNTMKRKQISYRSATSDVKYLRWDFDTVANFFLDNPSAAIKIRDLWAVQGALRAVQRQQDAEASRGGPEGGIGSIVQGVGDYGYGGDFTYGKRGDYGPLNKAVPGNVQQTAVWHFGREYAALRKALRVGELKEFIDAVSGARAWERVREGLRVLGERGEGGGLKGEVAAMFDAMDKDKSGTLSAREVYEGLTSVGISIGEDEVRKMVKAADKNGDGISLDELQEVISDVSSGKGAMKAALKEKGAWLPGFIAAPILAVLEALGGKVGEVDERVAGVVRPWGDKAETDQSSPEVREVLRLRAKLGELKLDNGAVWKREENRRDQIRDVLEAAMEEEKEEGGSPSELVKQLKTTESPAVIFGPYLFLCWLLDVLFTNRPIQRFWFLETVARMPYFSYITMLTLYESLGWWRSSSDVRRVHFAEEWNEVQHLKIMESLGGDRLWLDRFLARHAAIFYYVILNHVWLISPSFAYNFSELIEFHAVDTYGEFVDANEELLKSMPAPQEAKDYYEGSDLFMFDEFQTGREVSSRRPTINNLYDVFCNIRDDELEHVKTMFQCQTAEAQIVSPNTRKAMRRP